MPRPSTAPFPDVNKLRHEAIMKAKGITTFDAYMHPNILGAIRDGLIPPGIPGFSVEETAGDMLSITMENFETGPLSWLAAEAFGGLLRAAAEMAPAMTYLDPQLRAVLATKPDIIRVGPRGETIVGIGGGRGVAILSIGSSVAIKLASAATRSHPALKSLPRTVAAEFGAEISAAATVLRLDLQARRMTASRSPVEAPAPAAPPDAELDAFADFDVVGAFAGLDADVRTLAA